MKTVTSLAIGLALTSALSWSGCSTLKGENGKGEQISAAGPTVLFARSEPGTIELDRNLDPEQSPQILADVKDFHAKVTDVRVQFQHIPLEVPMENVGGTTWRATLSPRQLEMLAVYGKTMRYDAQVIATNDQGQVGMSEKPIEVAVKAPKIAQAGEAGKKSK